MLEKIKKIFKKKPKVEKEKRTYKKKIDHRQWWNLRKSEERRSKRFQYRRIFCWQVRLKHGDFRRPRRKVYIRRT